MEKQRIDRFLSNQTGLSRNTVRTGIKRGFCTVNGLRVKDISFYVVPEKDAVEYDGNRIGYRKYIYIILNKPSGYITACDDKSKKTVMELIPDKFKRKGLSPVGRLDKDTTGLLILTDDGDFAHRCISPKSNLEKSYIAELDGEVTEEIINEFKSGVILADGYKCRPGKLYNIGGGLVRVIVTEGKYHQIKRMFGVFGLGVNKLHRESVGSIKIPDDMHIGECIELTNFDPECLFSDILSVLDKT